LVDRRECRVEELGRRERQLVALAWRTLLPWAAAVKPFARAPGARQLLVDIVRHGGFERARPFSVGGDQPRDCGFDEGGFLGVEKDVGRWRRPRRLGGARRGRRGMCRSVVALGLCDVERKGGRQHRCADGAGRLDERCARQFGHGSFLGCKGEFAVLREAIRSSMSKSQRRLASTTNIKCAVSLVERADQKPKFAASPSLRAEGSEALDHICCEWINPAPFPRRKGRRNDERRAGSLKGAHDIERRRGPGEAGSACSEMVQEPIVAARDDRELAGGWRRW